jgi:hypothetical protein
LRALWGRFKAGKYLGSEFYYSTLFLSEEGKIEKMDMRINSYLLLNLLFKRRD